MKYIVGIDEVGRGPIAGPVAVCAFCCEVSLYGSLVENGVKETGVKLKDSKKLSKKQREQWFAYLKKCKKEGLCDYAVSFVSSDNIDRFGIVPSIKKALSTSLLKVSQPSLDVSVILDGGLKAPVEFKNQETVIKGDELHPIISCASVVAKVSRDNVMTNYAKDYPDYGFEKHSGYGTKGHYQAIKINGLSVIHRKSFIKNIK